MSGTPTSPEPIPVIVPMGEFSLPPVRARDLLLGSGPRLARDAFGPMLVFYVSWRLWGLAPGIMLATLVSVVALWHEQRNGRRGMMARIGLIFVVTQAVIGLATGSERLYLAQPVIVSAGFGLAFLASVVIRRPLTAAFAEEMYPFPDEVRASDTYRQAFSRISLVWGVYLLGRSALRLATLADSSVEAFLVVNLVTGVPLTAVLLGWSVWYGVRFFRRSEEWGDAIRMLDELATPVPVPIPPVDPSLTAPIVRYP
ncbi:MAG: VC0807 family protein [Acidimicrobiales bacterium]